MPNDVRVIVNPAAGRGRGAQLLPRIREAFAAVGVSHIELTQSAGDERTLARRAVAEGCTTLVAAGGDGTWSNAANAILEAGADCRLALLAAGTCNDFAKTAGAPAGDIAATARLAVEGPDRRIDVGRIEGRYFLNIAGFGFDIAVLEDCATLRWPHPGTLYLVSALRQLIGFPGVEIAVASTQGRRAAARHLMLIVANAKHFGGSFHIAPDAELGDGRLDAISILDAPALGRLGLFVAATRGTHTAHPRVVTEQAAAFTLTFPAPPAYETDGEYRRAVSAELEVTCVPGALRVVTP
ncbi:MAG: diacylglycerol kinase family lipid kinase [Candidatus Eisenbacteria bacterium]|nr:diacylglycerol kinase family lipid kinase [Candidatus Eisenbacteria bacterium]